MTSERAVGTMNGVRHRQADAACPLGDIKQVWTDGGITLACTDCEGLVEMPCPHCEYVHVPNKSGVGLTFHIHEKHPEHTRWVKAEGLVIPDA